MKRKAGKVPKHKGHLKLVTQHYTLCYGMRLDKGTAAEQRHPHVPVSLPNGSEGTMALHVINGTAEEIKSQLIESIDAFFDIYATS